MITILKVAVALMLPVSALALEPKDKAISKAAEAAQTAAMTDAWLRSGGGDGPLVYIDQMDYNFHKLIVAEIHRREKLSLRMTTLEEKADFKLSGDVKRREDMAEFEGRGAGWNGAKHFAALSLESTETGEVIWACHEDDRNKFDFNSTGRTLRRVAERCVNHLVKKITGK